MTIIVCVDSRMGQSFHRRRLSKDRVLSARVLDRAQGQVLRMSPYSAPLFFCEQGSLPAQVLVGTDYLERAAENDLCFVELEDLTPWLGKAQRIILYRWNRAYPYDLRFPIDLPGEGWRLSASEEFPGSSHEKITEETYEKS